MSRSQAVLAWLERVSDRISPIVVKEVRQLARGREFHYSFSSALLFGLVLAFFGAADALTGNGTSGRWTFGALMGVLGLLGLVVVPLGAFNALRHERLEQTFELMTLTALSPRRVVIGKLLAQAVKLATFFAGLAPFIAMSFLLGGIDFGTILLSMFVLFMWSLCVSAACLFLSSLIKSRAVPGFLFGILGVVVLAAIFVLGVPRTIFYLMTRGTMAPGIGISFAVGGSSTWWVLAMSTTFCVSLIVNLVLLAENRLSLPSQNRTTTLRIGFLGHLLLMITWALASLAEPSATRSATATVLLVFAAIHLALVATFTITEDLVVPRTVLLARRNLPAWRRFFAPLQPGGGNGALYVLLQMAIVLLTGWILRPGGNMIPWFLAACGYIAFFTGVHVVIVRAARPYHAASFVLRAAVLGLLALAMVVPDLVAYMLWQREGLDLSFSLRHLVSPFRTLANFNHIRPSWLAVPIAMGLTGVLAYIVLMHIGTRVMFEPAPVDPEGSATATGDPDRADVVY